MSHHTEKVHNFIKFVLRFETQAGSRGAPHSKGYIKIGTQWVHVYGAKAMGPHMDTKLKG